MGDLQPTLAMPRHREHLMFFRQWLRNPLRMASVVPSGRQLAQLMLSAMPEGARRVIELGAGTGVITEALLEHGIRPSNLLALEMSRSLHDLLRQRFPTVHLACTDARHLAALAARSGTFAAGADVVVSSLGLRAMPVALQQQIVAAAFEALAPQGSFVQYSYGVRSPLTASVCEALDLECRYAGTAWRNLPPARVYVYRRRGQARR